MAAQRLSRRTTLSLRTHLLLLIGGTLLPALVVATFLVFRVIADNRAAVEQRLLEAARASATLVDAELQGSIRALQALAESDPLTNDDVPRFYAEAMRLLPSQPTWSAVTLSRPDGSRIVYTDRPLGEKLPLAAERESLDRAVATKMPVIGDLREGQLTRQLGFLVRAPVVRDGVVVYVVSAWITPKGFADVLRRQASVSDEWVRGVTDANGVVVSRSREADRFVGQKGTPAFLQRYEKDNEGVYRDVTLDGVPVYGAFSRGPISGWIAGVAVPVSVVDAGFRQSMLALAAVALFLIGAGGGAAYWVSRRISQDISTAAADAEAFAGGARPAQRHSGVSEVQRLIDALARSAGLLERRERERNEEIARADAARAQAEAADRAKDEFLAMLGHELRNPLAPALTALHLMKQRGIAEGTRERGIVERQIQHMARLVDDLLDVSRLQRGAIDLRRERFELAEAVARAVEITSSLFQEKRHQLDVQVPSGLVIDCDRVRIAQVLSNILANAAKYTEANGHIALRARQEDDQIVIECEDDGIGMAPDLVPHVFDRFVQGQRGPDRRQGGLGLGLAVARTLVTVHGGTVEARSPGLGRGSTFTIRLPAASPEEAVGPSTSSPEAADHRPGRIGRVMVVDDNLDALEMLIEALKEAGVDVCGAAGSAEALALVARVHPDVAVLDIGLPEMDGFQLARALRLSSDGHGLRLIALTGYGQKQDRTAAQAAGFDAFFVKPVDVEALLDSLERLCAGSAAMPPS